MVWRRMRQHLSLLRPGAENIEWRARCDTIRVCQLAEDGCHKTIEVLAPPRTEHSCPSCFKHPAGEPRSTSRECLKGSTQLQAEFREPWRSGAIAGDMFWRESFTASSATSRGCLRSKLRDSWTRTSAGSRSLFASRIYERHSIGKCIFRRFVCG